MVFGPPRLFSPSDPVSDSPVSLSSGDEVPTSLKIGARLELSAIQPPHCLRVLFEKMSQCHKELRRVPNVPSIERLMLADCGHFVRIKAARPNTIL